MGINPLSSMFWQGFEYKRHGTLENHHLEKAAEHHRKQGEHLARIAVHERAAQRVENKLEAQLKRVREDIARTASVHQQETKVVVTEPIKVDTPVKAKKAQRQPDSAGATA